MFHTIKNFIDHNPISINIQILFYIYDADIICKIAAENGNLELLKLCICLYDPKYHKTDPFHLLQYPKTIHYPLNENVFTYAALGGYSHIIKYLFEVQCPYDCITASIFAQNEDIDSLSIIISNKDNYIYFLEEDDNFIDQFIDADYFNNYLDYRDIKKKIYEYFINNPFMTDLEKDNIIRNKIKEILYHKNVNNDIIITTASIMSGSIQSLKFLISKKYKVSKYGLYEASKRNYFNILVWLYDNKFYDNKYDENDTNNNYITNGLYYTLLGAFESKNFHIIDWCKLRFHMKHLIMN